MSHDLFLDCPQCSHTIKVSSQLMGVQVQCPDCANEFKVPEIRDGLSAGLKHPQPAARNDSLRRSGLLEDVLRIEEGLRSLLRRRHEQNRQLDLLQGNAELALKQLKLLEKTVADFEPAAVETGAGEASPDPAGFPWMKASLICAWLTLGGAVVMGFLYLRSL